MDQKRGALGIRYKHAVDFAMDVHNKTFDLAADFRQAVRINPVHDGHLSFMEAVAIFSRVVEAEAVEEAQSRVPVGQRHRDREDPDPALHGPLAHVA